MQDFVEANGAKCYFEMTGDGRPLVLVHAGIADSRMWDDQFHAFAQHYKVLRYDRRGFGRTRMVVGNYSHDHDLYALLTSLKIDAAYFIGCSQGAKTIVDFTLEYPEMTKGLVLVAPALGGFIFSGAPPKQTQQIELADGAGDFAVVNELELQIWVDGPHRAPAQVDARVRLRVQEMNALALLTPSGLGTETALEPTAANRLDEIKTPTLIVSGALDTPKPLAAADYLLKRVANARRVVMSNCAHFPNMESVADFNREVLAFLAGIDTR